MVLYPSFVFSVVLLFQNTFPMLIDLPQVNSELTETAFSISPTGDYMLFVRSDSFFNKSKKVIYYSKKEGKEWSPPTPISFTGDYSDMHPFLTYDGNRLYFTSTRPVDGSDEKDSDIWYVENLGDYNWGVPVPLTEVNSSFSEYSPSLDDAGNLYFGSTRNEESWGDLFVSRMNKSGTLGKPQRLPFPVSSDNGEWGSCISRDGQFLLFESNGREGGLSNDGDLYIAKLTSGTWDKIEHLKGYNSLYSDLTPKLYYENKTIILYFSSNREKGDDNTDIYKIDLTSLLRAF